MNDIKKYGFNKNIVSDFSGKNLTRNGGLLAMGEFLNITLNLPSLLDSLIGKNASKKTRHGKTKVIIQKIYGIWAGYTTDNIDAYIKNDPAFEALLGEVVPRTTVNRVINSLGKEITEALRKSQEELEKYNILVNKKKNVIIDVDTSFDEVSENVENSSYNTHYGTTGYSPILAFDGITGDLIRGELRPGNFHCSKEALGFIAEIVDFYIENDVSMEFRMDSGFATPEIYEYLESKGIPYYIKLKSNAVLKRKAAELADVQNQTPGKNVWLEFPYEAKSWEKERRVVCSIDWIRQETEESKKNGNGKKSEAGNGEAGNGEAGNKQYSLFPFYSFVVTNDQKYSQKEVFSMYNGRATVETLIEEGKNGFMMDRLSHAEYPVNSAVFQIHLLAMQIFQLFRKMTTGDKEKTAEKKKNKKSDVYNGTEYDGKFEGTEKIGRKEYALRTIATFRLILFSIPAVVVRKGRKLLFRFERTFGGRELYLGIMERLSLLPLRESSS